MYLRGLRLSGPRTEKGGADILDGMAVALSKSQIDKAGASLRVYVEQGVDCDLDDMIKVVEIYRAAYVVPLRVAQATAARAASPHTNRPVVARHKRTVRVIDKLVGSPRCASARWMT
jgi:hypothetical protein